MKKALNLAIILLFFIQIQLRADEGMWLLSLLEQVNMDEMSEMGLELTAEQIYSINNVSLKDAVGALDDGSCTAELVSADGLLLTNHHCGYEEIQSHSSTEHDYLKNGFWAMTREEELPNEGKTISFLVRMEEVTEQVLADVTEDMSNGERVGTIGAVTRQITSDVTEGTHYDANVKSMFNGNRYFLFVMETYLDVRLVGAPPESIGKFGSDTDNWVWPRHTGDFSIFRVYTGPDGKPAEYSPDNIPLKSKHYLPISLNGIEKGDFAMVLGFPGGTDRYITSWEVNELIEIEHPNRIKLWGTKLEIQMADMMSDEKIYIQYANKYYESSNYWKYSIGQKKGLENLNILGKKQKQEEQFIDWINEDDAREEVYGDALNMIKEAIEDRKEQRSPLNYLNETFFYCLESVQAAYDLMDLYGLLMISDPDTEELQAVIEDAKEIVADFYKDYNMPTDKKVMIAMLKILLEDLDAQYFPTFFADINKKYKGNVEKYVDKYFKKSIVPYEDKMMAFLNDPSFKVLEKDPAFQVTFSMINAIRQLYLPLSELDEKYTIGSRLYLKGLMEMYSDKNLYSDANSTIRLTYGTVGDYKARDAVYYAHYTTMKGVIEKEDPDNYEFIVPEKLKELYENKDYGQYSEGDIMKVCFTTNNDITGGNSGSPVINGKGELIGIAFDGNWESMSGDIVFEPGIQKCINVDIRYVLLIISKYAGATHLIDEMKLVH